MAHMGLVFIRPLEHCGLDNWITTAHEAFNCTSSYLMLGIISLPEIFKANI